MNITIYRNYRTDKSTISDLYVDGNFQCYILEDKDRGLTNEMTEEEIKEIKIHGKTAIPTGTYEIIITLSNRFKRRLPLLLNVKGFAGIRIHSGNTSENTEGCLLTGETRAIDFVGNSRAAFQKLYDKISETIKKQKVFITIK